MMLRNVLDIFLPLIGIGVMVYYDLCDTRCTALRGSLWGLDLKYIGIAFMALWFMMAIPYVSRKFPRLIRHLKTVMISGAMGGEVILLRFQIVTAAFCPFCVIFALCIACLFIIHVRYMNRYLACAGFLAGIVFFSISFHGSVLPLYTNLRAIGASYNSYALLSLVMR